MKKITNGFSKPSANDEYRWDSHIDAHAEIIQSKGYIKQNVIDPTWAGIGTLLIFIFGILFFQESINAIKVISALLIILGVIGLNL